MMGTVANKAAIGAAGDTAAAAAYTLQLHAAELRGGAELATTLALQFPSMDSLWGVVETMTAHRTELTLQAKQVAE